MKEKKGKKKIQLKRKKGKKSQTRKVRYAKLEKEYVRQTQKFEGKPKP